MLRFIIGQSAYALFMLGFEMMQVIDGICALIIIDYIVVTTTHQDQVVIAVALLCCLIFIPTRAAFVSRFNVADFSDNFVAFNQRRSAFWKCAAIARHRKEALNCCGTGSGRIGNARFCHYSSLLRCLRAAVLGRLGWRVRFFFSLLSVLIPTDRRAWSSVTHLN